MAPSTYYAAKDRAPSARALSDATITPELVTLWEDNYRVYGVRKLWKTALRAGIGIGEYSLFCGPLILRFRATGSSS